MVNKYPISDGTFIQSDMVKNWDDEKWEKEFYYLKQVRMHYIILMGTSITKDNITKTIYVTKQPGMVMDNPTVDIVDTCLRNAEKAGIRVFLGINFNSDWWKKGWINSKWMYSQMEKGNLVTDELYSNYYFRYPNAFYGWYWAYEVDNLNFRTKLQFAMLASAININLRHLDEKKHRLPFMISPFMNSKYGTPKKYAKNWAYLFEHTDLRKGDIFCPQDSVGAKGVKMEEVDIWFCELRKAVDVKPGLLFWANAECFNQTNWSSATLNRFVKQMEIESTYVDNSITFAYSHYYSPNNIDKGFHKTYLQYVERGYLEKENPTSPKKVVVKQLVKNKISINWEPATDNIGIYGYEVYRNDTLIFSTNVQRVYGGNKDGILISYIDKPKIKLGKNKFSYKVTAVDFAGNISKPSIAVTIFISNTFLKWKLPIINN